MQNPNIAETQPIPPQAGSTKPVRVRPQKNKNPWLLWVLLAIVLVGLGSVTGALAGYQSGQQARLLRAQAQSTLSLQQQYELGMQDMQSGQFEVAKQRFEFILQQNPGFPGAADRLAEAMAILYATATPTPVTPTAAPSATPTRDLRPIQDLFAQAQAQFASEGWNAMIDTIIALRKEDAQYQAPVIDGMLYLALRNRGVEKITSRDLEGGIYDLALAESFGPVDVEASGIRSLARMYITGNSFWEVSPEQAVYYFGQVAAASPYLTDASGWTARERYRGALVQYGDLLAQKGDWCSAEDQYRAALDIRADDALQAAYAQAVEGCTPPTATPEPPTETATITPTLEIPPTATNTQAVPTEPPTIAPTTETPPTAEPPTAAPPTDTPAPTAQPSVTPAPTTAVPTAEPPTVPPPTLEPPTAQPPTLTPTTEAAPTASEFPTVEVTVPVSGTLNGGY